MRGETNNGFDAVRRVTTSAAQELSKLACAVMDEAARAAVVFFADSVEAARKYEEREGASGKEEDR